MAHPHKVFANGKPVGQIIVESEKGIFFSLHGKNGNPTVWFTKNGFPVSVTTKMKRLLGMRKLNLLETENG